MQTRPSFRLLICAAVTLYWIAGNLPPSKASPTPLEIFIQPILQNPASPTPGAVLPQTLVPTETPPPNETQNPTLPPTPTGAPTKVPAFDITKRMGQPVWSKQALSRYDIPLWVQPYRLL